MSHFTVLVVTDTPEDVESALQPFHEYECTGIKDEHVVWVDETEERNKEYNEDTIPMIFKDDEMLYSKYSDEAKKFFHKDRSEPFARDEFILDDGYELKDVIANKVYSTAREYLIDWCGYTEDNFKGETVGRYTNPNAQWDWWTIGGRWSGLLKPKNSEIGMKGEKGLMGSEYDPKGVDQCIKSNVDFDGRMKETAFEAEKKYRQAHIVIDGRTFKSWDECREDFEDIQDARDFYHGQEVVKDLKVFDDSFYANFEDYQKTREEYVSMKSNSAISTFAVLKDGQWYERGSMGWWGCVGDEKNQDDWNGEFKDLIDTIPDDKCLTVVDCHI